MGRVKSQPDCHQFALEQNGFVIQQNNGRPFIITTSPTTKKGFKRYLKALIEFRGLSAPK